MLPNFLGIGAQRSGTTWLNQNLKKHPDVYLPSFQKELHYFNTREIILSKNFFQRFFLLQDPIPKWLKRKIKWRDQIFQEKIQQSISQLDFMRTFKYTTEYLSYSSDELYASVFELNQHKIAGEITPAYAILEKESIRYIHQIMPNLKIIFLMRNPIERAWSFAVYSFKKQGFKSLNNISDKKFIDEFNSESSQLKGNYLRTIDNWKSYYPDEQFLTCFFEEIKEDTDNLMLRIGDFLDIEISLEYLNSIHRNKVNSSQQKDGKNIPDNFAVYLAKMYIEQIEQLEAQFGGYTTNWLKYAKKILHS